MILSPQDLKDVQNETSTARKFEKDEVDMFHIVDDEDRGDPFNSEADDPFVCTFHPPQLYRRQSVCGSRSFHSRPGTSWCSWGVGTCLISIYPGLHWLREQVTK